MTRTLTKFNDEYFEHQGVTLHYVEALPEATLHARENAESADGQPGSQTGSRPLVIFYHGFPLFWFSWHHQLEALRDHYRVVAVDGPGVNLSSKPQDLAPFRLPQLAEQLDQLAQRLAPGEKFYLVGHDWGAALAWSYAQAFPQRLHKVVGINAPPTNQLLGLLESNPEQQKRSSYMYSMRDGDTHKLITENRGERMWKNAYAKLRALPHYTAEHDDIFRAGLGQPGAIDGGINWYRANIPPIENIREEHFWPSRDASTSVPGLLIWGELDDTFVSTFIDELNRFVDTLEVCRIPNAGHSPMLEVPDQVNELLRAFLVQ